MIVRSEFRDLDTPTGPMRTYVYTPVHPTGARKYPGLLLYPEIFQQTAPIARLSRPARRPRLRRDGAGDLSRARAARVPCSATTTRARTRGTRYKHATKLSTFDDDAEVVVRALRAHPRAAGGSARSDSASAGTSPSAPPCSRRSWPAPRSIPTDLHTRRAGRGEERGHAGPRGRDEGRAGDDLGPPGSAHPGRGPGEGLPGADRRPASSSAGTSSTRSTPSCATRARATIRRRRGRPWASPWRCSGGRCSRTAPRLAALGRISYDGEVRRRAWALAAAMLLLAGCRVSNYLEPAQPFYATHDGVARDKEPGLRVVTFNVKEGQKIAEAIAALGRHPDLRDADVVVLQEMNAEGVAAVARALRMNSAYFPATREPGAGRDWGNAVLSPWPSRTRTRSSCRISAASAAGAGPRPASSSAMARAPSASIRRIWARRGTPEKAAGATRPPDPRRRGAEPRARRRGRRLQQRDGRRALPGAGILLAHARHGRDHPSLLGGPRLCPRPVQRPRPRGSGARREGRERPPAGRGPSWLKRLPRGLAAPARA